jgi:uncharacterized protein YndB with AHSA1/START domain
MNEFELVSVIDRPVADVFAALKNFDRAPDWNPGLIEARSSSDVPFGVGSKVVYVGKFLGRSYESPAVCTEYVADKKLTTKSDSGPFLLEVATEVEPTDGGTKVTSIYRGESRGFFRLAEPVVVHLTKRQFELATDNLKALLEAGEI